MRYYSKLYILYFKCLIYFNAFIHNNDDQTSLIKFSKFNFVSNYIGNSLLFSSIRQLFSLVRVSYINFYVVVCFDKGSDDSTRLPACREPGELPDLKQD